MSCAPSTGYAAFSNGTKGKMEGFSAYFSYYPQIPTLNPSIVCATKDLIPLFHRALLLARMIQNTSVGHTDAVGDMFLQFNQDRDLTE